MSAPITARLVAVSVYAFGKSGAVALFGVLRILPALVLRPIVTSVADRVPGERVLLWTVSVRAAALALVCAAIVAGSPLLVVVGIALAVSGPPLPRRWRQPSRAGFVRSTRG